MIWIDVHQELRGHPKVRKLAEKLKIQEPYALGMLVNLWLWAVSYAPHGDLKTFSPQYIADACQWHGPAGLLKAALKFAGWIDSDDKLHDWSDHRLHYDAYQEAAERRREQTRERVKNYRDRKRFCNALQDVTVTPRVPDGNAHTVQTVQTSLPPPPPFGGQGAKKPPAGDKGGHGKAKDFEPPLAEVVDGFTIILDQNIGDSDWKAVYGRSIARHSKKLLTLFGGDAGKCLDCIEGVVKHAKEKRWSDWTPKTIVERAGDWKAGRLGQ